MFRRDSCRRRWTSRLWTTLWSSPMRPSQSLGSAMTPSRRPHRSSSPVRLKAATPQGSPGITGVPQVGQTLTATAGDMADDDNLPTTTFPTGYSFQWVRTDADGSNPQDISGATSATYQPVAADVGKKLLVKVDFTDGGGCRRAVGERRDGDSGGQAGELRCNRPPRP